MKPLLVLLGLLVFFAPAYADAGGSPVIFSKTILKIIPAPAPINAKAPDRKDALPRIPKDFIVEVRPEQFLDQHDFMAYTPLTEKNGILILIEPAQITALKSSNLLGTVDVLFISPEGQITKIAPGLTLSTLENPISSEIPVHAFLLLKAGNAKASDIRPGDHVENSLFRAQPVILDETAPPAAPPPSPEPAPENPVNETAPAAPPKPAITVIMPNQNGSAAAHAPLIIPSLQSPNANATPSPQR